MQLNLLAVFIWFLKKQTWGKVSICNLDQYVEILYFVKSIRCNFANSKSDLGSNEVSNVISIVPFIVINLI
jgi:hypothetical protein